MILLPQQKNSLLPLTVLPPKQVLLFDELVYDYAYMSKEILEKLNEFTHEIQQKIHIDTCVFISHSYLVTLPIDNEYFLFLTTIDCKKYSFFISKDKTEVYYTKFRFKEELYNDTLFLGSFKRNKTKLVFLISDIHYHSGLSCFKTNFSQRLKLVYSILKNDYTWDEHINICSLEIKSHFLYNYLENLKEVFELHFIPERYSDNILVITINTQQTIRDNLKNNCVNCFKTIYASKYPDVYHHSKTEEEKNIMYVKTKEQSKKLRDYFKVSKSLVIMCHYNTSFEKWEIDNYSDIK